MSQGTNTTDLSDELEKAQEEPPPKEEEDEKKKEDKPLASVADVFSFGAGRKKRICIVLGLCCAVVSGCVFPAMAFLFARSFEDLSASGISDTFMDQIRNLAYSFMVLGAIAFVSMSGQATLLETSAGIMTHDFKTQWFDALLRQDLAYYDIKDISGTASVISVNGAKYKKGLGRKLGAGVQFFITFLGGLAYAFWASWSVTLMLLTTVPVFVVSTLFLVKMNQTQSSRASAGYAEAGSIVQTTVASIRTILSLNAVQSVIDKFMEATEKAYRAAIGILHWIGLANGGMMASMMLGYIVIVLFGAWLLYEDVRKTGCDASGSVPGNEACNPDGAEVFGSLMGITFAAAVLPQVSVGIEAFTDARAACYPAMQVINRKVGDEEPAEAAAAGPVRRGSLTAALPKYVIDSSSDDGVKLDTVLGAIEYDNVTFAYPTRLERNVFDGFSLKIEPGQTVALVGPSGCGKSSAVQLLERFYDPLGGAIKLDHYDLRHLNVHWLRDQIGLVGQEPVLFACSIRDNIAYGAPGVTQDDIEEAAKMANAHDFILSFPDGYDTQVGDKGAHLSGGQKQRIAIARVLVRQPKILLLDEATSALDSESERVVQEALDHVLAERKRTTLVIAHRLSTIRNADLIAVVEEGRIVEQGTHDELIALEGEYNKLVEAQKAKDRSDDSDHNSSSRRQSYVDVSSLNGQNGSPALRFRDVHFRFPARPDIEIFRGLNLTVHNGETLALVGPSGHGKSTTIQLLERFYDPSSGSIEMDGVDLKELNVHWLRDQFGLVSQEPVLFDTTVRENIRFGVPNATQEQVEEAARMANAHDFIVSFPDGYDTQVGAEGTQVSGGQKQRIAIARALLRRPRFLLLDEATSALDSESERVVQAALDKIMASDWLTTIVIAHRLSTIRDADRIAVISDGKVREIGTHDELMAKPNGRYRRLQAFQNLEGADALFGPLKPRVKKSLRASAKGEDEEDEAEEEGEGEIDKDTEKRNAKRARLLAKDDWSLLVLGGLGALLTGLVFPAWGIIFAYVIELLYTPIFPCDDTVMDCQAYWDSEADDMRTLSFQLTGGCFAIMVIALLGSMLIFWAFGKASERILRRVRNAAFTALVRQEVAYFDMRPVGVITSQLEEDAAMIHSFSGEPIRTLIINLSSVLVGLVISFVYMWPFALLTLAILPFMGFGAEMEMKLYFGEDEGDVTKLDQTSPGGIVIETLVNIRTVASLNLERERSAEFSQAMHDEDPTPFRTNFFKGSATGLGQFIQMWGLALMFWWGGWLLDNYGETFTYRDFLISMFSLLFGLEGMGIAMQGATNREKAKQAANRMFELTDRKSAIDPLSEDGLVEIPKEMVPLVEKDHMASVKPLDASTYPDETEVLLYAEDLQPSPGLYYEGNESWKARAENDDLHELLAQKSRRHSIASEVPHVHHHHHHRRHSHHGEDGHHHRHHKKDSTQHVKRRHSTQS